MAMRHVWTLAAACVVAMVGALLAATVGGATAAVDSGKAEDPDAQPSIVGGEPVPGGKYEFVAALRNTERPGDAWQQQFCGGALIDRNSVLTAAHCVEDISAARMLVTVGRADLRTNAGQTRGVAARSIHPRFAGSSVGYEYDVAVLQLGSPVAGIAPVKIPATARNAFEEPGRGLTIAGWGNTRKQSPDLDEPDSYPYRMQEAEVPVVSDSRAKSVYGPGYTKSLMVSAGREGKDACQGDSGGPLFERTANGPYQVGVVSFGAGCGARFPGAYAETNAAAIKPYIVQRAAANN